MEGRPFSISVLNVQATSCAVTGVPSEKRASGRISKAIHMRSAGISMVWARWP